MLATRFIMGQCTTTTHRSPCITLFIPDQHIGPATNCNPLNITIVYSKKYRYYDVEPQSAGVHAPRSVPRRTVREYACDAQLDRTDEQWQCDEQQWQCGSGCSYASPSPGDIRRQWFGGSGCCGGGRRIFGLRSGVAVGRTSGQ